MIPLINGVAYSSANVTVIVPVLGAVVGITEINYGKTQQIDDNWGLDKDPISRSFGQNKYTGNIIFYKEAWNKIIDASPLRDPMQLPYFDIIVTYGGAGVPFRKETLRAVNFKNNPSGVKGGDTKILCNIELAIGGIDY